MHLTRPSLGLFAAVLTLSLLLTACGGPIIEPQPQPTRPAVVPDRPSPVPTPVTGFADEDDQADDADDGLIEPDDPEWVDFEIEILATHLDIPWELVFFPDGDVFITERPGQVRLMRDGELQDEPILVFDDVAHDRGAEGGLLGMALHPEFSETGWIYFYYTYRDDEDDLRNQVVRYVLEDDTEFTDRTVIIDDLPGAFTHNGGRIKFGPDGKLYVTLGDAQRQQDTQDPEILVGKILRINDDGTFPEDNPFEDSPVYALGLRNPQGLAWHPETGELYASQHGPTGNDELNLIVSGANYGWPDMEGFDGDYRQEFTLPVMASGEHTWAPSGSTFVTGDLFPQWHHEYLLAGLRSVTLYRVNLDGDEPEIGPIVQGIFGRLRTVVEGPDGYLYVLTSNRDKRQEPAEDDDKLLRIVPAE